MMQGRVRKIQKYGPRLASWEERWGKKLASRKKTVSACAKHIGLRRKLKTERGSWKKYFNMYFFP